MEAKTGNRTSRENNRGGVLITHDGKVYTVPYNGRGLEELYKLINCNLVEAVRLHGPLDGFSMWCDEEGKLKLHKANIPASLLYRYICGGDYMAGRCLVLKDDPETGDAVALSPSESAFIIRAIGAAVSFADERGDVVVATGPSCHFYAM